MNNQHQLPPHLPATRVEISASAILHNLQLFKEFIGTENYLAPVLKSNAYGHGSALIAQLCEQSPHVDYMCLSSIEEALVLRSHGITKPIVTLYLNTLSPDILKAAIANDIDLMIYDVALLATLNALAQKADKPAQLHLKVDTGLHRFGIFPNEVVPFITTLKKFPYLNLRGIATHGAGATADDPSLMLSHLQKFDKVLAELEQYHMLPPLRHAQSTAGMLRFDHGKQNFFRVGDGTYGIWQKGKTQILAQYPQLQLQPALTFKTIVTSIKKVPAGATIGYDRAYTTKRTTTLALLPVGYYDGYTWRGSATNPEHAAHVEINGHFAPVIGVSTMNVTTIDITDIPNIQLGTEVILVGQNAPADAQSYAYAHGCGNPTEILTNIAGHIPRILVP